ncbi:MAG TPA: hypothetical protein DCE43_07195 [Planctomycetaceae bacterium]|nr:hypothetical protein [Planctomycetaceae bacterium]|tara:strand:+ start:459 stop:698 length:240 start_codon:yes stop_codon:yes gene_type:complete
MWQLAVPDQQVSGRSFDGFHPEFRQVRTMRISAVGLCLDPIGTLFRHSPFLRASKPRQDFELFTKRQVHEPLEFGTKIG